MQAVVDRRWKYLARGDDRPASLEDPLQTVGATQNKIRRDVIRCSFYSFGPQ